MYYIDFLTKFCLIMNNDLVRTGGFEKSLPLRRLDGQDAVSYQEIDEEVLVEFCKYITSHII